MNFSDFSADERIFVAAFYYEMMGLIAEQPMLNMKCALGQTEFMGRLFERYNDCIQETMVSPNVASEHGVSAYVYQNMSQEKQSYFNQRLTEDLNFIDEPIVTMVANSYRIKTLNDLMR